MRCSDGISQYHTVAVLLVLRSTPEFFLVPVKLLSSCMLPPDRLQNKGGIPAASNQRSEVSSRGNTARIR